MSESWADMEIVFDRKKLFSLLKNYHLATGLRIGVYDGEQQAVCTYPVSHSGFCREIRRQKSCRERCFQCDREAFEQAKSSKDLHIYRCHAGLTEAVAPLFYEEEHIGYLMIGQFRADRDQFVPERLQGAVSMEALCRLEKLFYLTPNLDRARIQASAAIVQACAAYILSERYIRFLNDDLAKGIRQYLREHYSQPVTLEALSRQFHVSRATLCRSVRENFGKTVGELLLQERIQAAKSLLSGTDLRISEISRQVGIGDYNYFSKIFKRETGRSPREYRREKGV